MNEHPILFSGSMVQAILDGRKTKTRRVIKPQPPEGAWPVHDALDCYEGEGWAFQYNETIEGPLSWNSLFMLPNRGKCPYGKPGDILHEREASWIWCEKRPNGTTPTGRPKYRYISVGEYAIYCADHPERPTERIDDDPTHMWRYKTGRFMPRWASRITLRVTDVRVERLQEITEEDAKAEGVYPMPWYGEVTLHPGRATDRTVHGLEYPVCYRNGFANLWDSINTARGFGWDTNCWVWVVSFERVTV